MMTDARCRADIEGVPAHQPTEDCVHGWQRSDGVREEVEHD
jgi:hypothetical protein